MQHLTLVAFHSLPYFIPGGVQKNKLKEANDHFSLQILVCLGRALRAPAWSVHHREAGLVFNGTIHLLKLANCLYYFCCQQKLPSVSLPPSGKRVLTLGGDPFLQPIRNNESSSGNRIN